MEVITKTELEWIANLLKDSSENLVKSKPFMSRMERSFAELRAEQFDGLAKRLSKVASSTDKRIKIV